MNRKQDHGEEIRKGIRDMVSSSKREQVGLRRAVASAKQWGVSRIRGVDSSKGRPRHRKNTHKELSDRN